MHRRRGRNSGRQSAPPPPECAAQQSGLLGVVKTELGVTPAACPALFLDGAEEAPREVDVPNQTCADGVTNQDWFPDVTVPPQPEQTFHNHQSLALSAGDDDGCGEERERAEGVDAGVESRGADAAEGVGTDAEVEGVIDDAAGFGVEEEVPGPVRTMGLGNRCASAGCARRPTYSARLHLTAEFCVQHRSAGMVQVEAGTCGIQGCNKIRSYGVPGTNAPLYCAEHALPNMKNVITKKRFCIHEQGCGKGRRYGVPGGKAEFCAEHAPEGMVLVSPTVCDEAGCYTTASFFSEDRKIKFCAKHGASKGLVSANVIRRRKTCAEAGCTVRASWGVKGRGPEFCARHAIEGMTDRKRFKKTCAQENCTKRPIFAAVGETKTSHQFCAQHATPDMVDVVNRKCGHEGGCQKQPTHGVAGTKKRQFCAEHALPGLVNLHVKACSHTDCSKKATHGVVGSTLREFCAKHAAEGMAVIPPTRRGPRVKRARNVGADTVSGAAPQAPAPAAAAATAASTGEKTAPEAVSV